MCKCYAPKCSVSKWSVEIPTEKACPLWEWQLHWNPCLNNTQNWLQPFQHIWSFRGLTELWYSLSDLWPVWPLNDAICMDARAVWVREDDNKHNSSVCLCWFMDSCQQAASCALPPPDGLEEAWPRMQLRKTKTYCNQCCCCDEIQVKK